MKNLEYQLPGFQSVTYLKGNSEKPLGEEVASAASTTLKNHPLIIRSADEIPLFYYQKGVFLGAVKLSLEDSESGRLEALLAAAIKDNNLKPAKLSVYFGPALTFSHVPVTRDFIIKMMGKGYRLACKRTSGVDYFDPQIANLLILRRLGIPMENIYISDYDTFENADLLFSRARGDKEENITSAYIY